MKICVNAICKNEGKNLTEGFATLKDADYIAILDTGSTDGTGEALQKFQSQEPNRIIIKQQLFNPFYFDDARNAAMSLIPSDVDGAFALDFDERINQDWRQSFNNISTNSNIYRFFRRDVVDGRFGQYVPMLRIGHNDDSVKWFKHVHETLGDAAIGPHTYNYPDLQIFIEHYEDNDSEKGRLYNEILKQHLEWSGNMQDNYSLIANYENLAYQHYLLHDYTNAGKYLKGGIDMYNSKTPELRKQLDWGNGGLEKNKEMYRMAAEKKIAIYAICKNELKFVDKWFESMNEANYICVLDTGSTDGTYEKLLEYQEKYPYQVIVDQKIITPWRFDVARNESLKLVPEDTDIYFCTDLDELLEPGWAAPLREIWINGQHTRATYKYVWSHLDNGEPGRIFGYNKIHSKKWIWRYPVHELLWDNENQTENYPTEESANLGDKITLHHYPDRTKSRSSYLGLLEMREADYPEDCYGLIYLSHEYRYHNMWEKSIEKLYKVLEKYDDVVGIVERASCYLFLGDNYSDLKQYDKAIESYKKGIEVEPTYRELYLNLAKVYLELKEYNLAVQYIKEGLVKSYRHYSWLERDLSWSYEPYDLLCLAYFYSGDKLRSLGCAYKALQYFPEDERLKRNVEVILQGMKETDW